MHRTIFTTPVVNTALRALSLAVLRVKGWQVEGSLPANFEKCVLIAAPHTSNWDLPYTLMVAFVLRLNVYWVGKASLFRPPFGPVMRWLGGIAVNREQSINLVAASARALQAADGRVQLVVAPQGTRGKSGEAPSWKTGFYYIAQGAGVPILMAYLDYAQKRGGLGPTLTPSGDVQKDMETVKAFYAPFQGRRAKRADAQRSTSSGQLAQELLLKQELLAQVFIGLRADLMHFLWIKMIVTVWVDAIFCCAECVNARLDRRPLS